MIERRRVSTSKGPAAIGPYSQAIVAGDLVFVSGQIALDPATGALVPGDVAAQAEQVMKNLGAILEAAGSSFARAVRTTIYLKEMADFETVNRIYGKAFTADPPARATVQVAGLPKGALLEIDLVALKGD